jgi:hypothetical protein
VEVTYTSRVDFPRMSGRVEVFTPQLDIKLNNAHWWLFLPRDYDYSKYKGSMDHMDSKAISRRTSKLDVNQDGRLDKNELGKDSQLGEMLDTGQHSLELAKANPRSGAVYGYDKSKYEGQEQFNTVRVLDNIARQQKIVESNLDADNLSGANRYNDQSIQSLNQLAGALKGSSNERDNKKLNDLFKKQRALETRRRDRQIQEEQYAQQNFAFRNTFKPQQWAGQNAGTSSGQSQTRGPAGIPALLAVDPETLERQKRQVDEIDRIQKRVTTGEVTPLNINLPREGLFLAFSQPLQTEKGKPMNISFKVENMRRTNWWIVGLWSALGISLLHFLVTVVRQFALRKTDSDGA